MGSTVASQREGRGFDSRAGPFCVEFACSPRVSVGSLRVLRFLPQSKDMQDGDRFIGDSKCPVGVNVSVNGCLSLHVSL